MIAIEINEASFEYDIHSLVKAFFPKEEVHIFTKDQKEGVAFKHGSTNGHALQKEDGLTLNIEFTATPPEGQEHLGQCNDRIFIALCDPLKETSKTVSVDFTDRRQTKNKLKQALYQVLRENTNRELPWGTLTGIRPTKIPMAFLEQGKSKSEIKQYMADTYFASTSKIELSIAVAERELNLLKQLDFYDGYSLYIGIPFCPSTCLYCSFTSYPLAKWVGQVEEYLTALEREIDFVSNAYKGKYVNTIYIGGGTPTTLLPEQLERLFAKIEQCFDLSKLLEYTVEAGRPDSISREKLKVLKKHHISRISINPQTMKQATLDFVGRNHTVEQTTESFILARELGFDQINMDLIVGLPQETPDDIANTMEQLKPLDPDSITVHSLAIKRASRLRMLQEENPDFGQANIGEMMELTAKYAREMGHVPYYLYRQKNMAGNFENVGYAKPGKEGIYNILMMEEKQSIIALGAGAITKFVFAHGTQIERIDNVKDITNYLERIDEMVERKKTAFKAYRAR
ncbi:coproporphyrinogen dehydrogenase HemZ [Lachnospiraceae bacterium ZAX-1]